MCGVIGMFIHSMSRQFHVLQSTLLNMEASLYAGPQQCCSSDSFNRPQVSPSQWHLHWELLQFPIWFLLPPHQQTCCSRAGIPRRLCVMIVCFVCNGLLASGGVMEMMRASDVYAILCISSANVHATEFLTRCACISTPSRPIPRSTAAQRRGW